MNVCLLWLLILTGLIFYVETLSLRKIFTLFTSPKTWNEAHGICESQYGQLAKIHTEQELLELNLLFHVDWNGTTGESEFWCGLHRPFSNVNESWQYQDCEANTGSTLAFTNPTPLLDGQHCAYFHRDTLDALYQATCSDRRPFICQRYSDDCWFEPFPGEAPANSAPSHTMTDFSAEQACDCAMACRDEFNPECWGFLWKPNEASPCQHVTIADDSASSFYVNSTNRQTGADEHIFYVRRCFEGVADESLYSDYTDGESIPETACSTLQFQGQAAAANICFCSAVEKPPITPPISSEDRAQQYVQQLTMDTANTSSAQRKLISAEDNRPSAMSVGILGVGLLTAVFGGIILMDVPLLIATMKEWMCTNPSPTVTTWETEC